MKKTVIIIISIIAMISLAKCGYDEYTYGDMTPKVNPHPTKKMRIHGKFPFDENVTLKFDVAYVNKNPKCDTVHKAFGVFTAAVTKKIEHLDSLPATINKDGTYEATVSLDSYLPGVCEYEPSYISAHFIDSANTHNRWGIGVIKLIDNNILTQIANVNCEQSNINFPNSMDKYILCKLRKTKNVKYFDIMLNNGHQIPLTENNIELNFKFKGKK